MRGAWLLIVASALLSGCKPELPSLDYRGERVMVGSDEVDQVCRGTLRRIDREVEQIEATLDLPRQDSWFRVYIVDHDTEEAYCPGAAGCTLAPQGAAPFVVIDQREFEWSIRHELTHARLVASRSVPLFDEGVAVAMSSPSCPRRAPDVDLEEILMAKGSDEFIAATGGAYGGYYIAGELVAWLLGEFGPGPVVSLLQSVNKDATPSTIRSEYSRRFDRELDVDVFAHSRSQAELDALAPDSFGCMVDVLDASAGAVALVADLDCDSDRVNNDFGLEGSGYVEWTVVLQHAEILRLVGEVPLGTSLTVEECGCVPNRDDEYRLARPFDAHQSLQPGTYRLRWIGALDEGLSLDVEIVAQ